MKAQSLIGDRVEKIFYRKGQRHACDSKCKAANHRFVHTFTKKTPVVAGPGGKGFVPLKWKTFRTSGGSEKFIVDNPPLIIANAPKTKRKDKKKMARTFKMRRDSKGHFIARSSSGGGRKRKRTKARRSNPPWWTAGAIVNHKRKRSRARSNPPALRSIAGIPLVMPDISAVVGITGGIVGPPLVKGFTLRFLPANLLTNTAAQWAVSAFSYAAPPVVGYLIGGRAAMRWVLAGELAGFLVGLVQKATASLAAGASPASTAVSGYMRPGAALALNGYTAPEGLGFTTARTNARATRFSSRR